MSKTPTLEEQAHEAAQEQAEVDHYADRYRSILERLRAVEAATIERCAKKLEDRAREAKEAAFSYDRGDPARRMCLNEAGVLNRAASAIRYAK